MEISLRSFHAWHAFHIPLRSIISFTDTSYFPVPSGNLCNLVTYLSLARTGGCVVPPYIDYCKSKVWRLESIVRTRHIENDVYAHSTGSSAPRLQWVQTLQTFEVQWGIFEIKIGSAAYGMVYHHLGEMKFVGVIGTRCGPTGMRPDWNRYLLTS